jgi:hypothetical protein
MADKKALVDSGATNNFIHPRFAERMRLGTKKLTQPRKIWNIDGTQNKGGLLTEYIDLDVQTKHIHKEMRFLVTDLGGEDIILGYPWLSTFEPQITWRTATINVSALPIVIRTVNPRIEQITPVIARTMSQIEAALRSYNNSSTQPPSALQPPTSPLQPERMRLQSRYHWNINDTHAFSAMKKLSDSHHHDTITTVGPRHQPKTRYARHHQL